MPSSDSSVAAVVAATYPDACRLVCHPPGPRHGALLLLLRLDRLRQLQPPVAESPGKVTRSLLVCLGLGIGRVLSEDKSFWMGLAGLVAAPVAASWGWLRPDERGPTGRNGTHFLLRYRARHS